MKTDTRGRRIAPILLAFAAILTAVLATPRDASASSATSSKKKAAPKKKESKVAKPLSLIHI